MSCSRRHPRGGGNPARTRRRRATAGLNRKIDSCFRWKDDGHTPASFLDTLQEGRTCGSNEFAFRCIERENDARDYLIIFFSRSLLALSGERFILCDPWYWKPYTS